MSSFRLVAAVSSLSAGIGFWVGHHKTQSESSQKGSPTTTEQLIRFNNKEIDRSSSNNHAEPVPEWYSFLPVPYKVSAASAPLDKSLSISQSSSNTVIIPTNRVGEIMQFGYPNLDNVRFYEDYVVSYDRRSRTAHWVFEHIKAEHCEKQENIDRGKSRFKEDESFHPYFRSTNSDYKGSGYDRGHLAAASNHRHSQSAMDQTFILSNVSPQVLG